MHGWGGKAERGARCRLASPRKDSDHDTRPPLNSFGLRIRLAADIADKEATRPQLQWDCSIAQL